MSGILSGPISSLVRWATAPRRRNVYFLEEGNAEDHRLLSPKGANLCEVAKLGISTPPAFIISTDICRCCVDTSERPLPKEVIQDVFDAVVSLEEQTGNRFGSVGDSPPLLLCLRVGFPLPQIVIANHELMTPNSFEPEGRLGMRSAPESLMFPGVQETIVGIGMNDMVCDFLSTIASPLFALNLYANFLLRFCTKVLKADPGEYQDAISRISKSSGRSCADFQEEELKLLLLRFKQIQACPEDVWEQLRLALGSAYHCWFADKAIRYRENILGLPFDCGIGIIVQSMVLGGSGCCFSRSPWTGEAVLVGEYWPDPASTQRLTITELQLDSTKVAVFDQLKRICKRLEGRFKDMQDVEFIVDESNVVNVLQSRAGRRSPRADMRISIDMVEENLITQRQALLRVDPMKSCAFFASAQVSSIHTPKDASMTSSECLEAEPCFSGLASSQGAVSGVACMTSHDVLELDSSGESVIYVVDERTAFVDVLQAAIDVSQGVILFGGSLTSDVSVLCRSLAKPCVLASSDLLLDPHEFVTSPGNGLKHGRAGVVVCTDGKVVFGGGDVITVDGTNGSVYLGKIPVELGFHDVNFQKILKWADRYRSLKVYSTVSLLSEEEIRLAKKMGCDGFLCVGTDRMFSSTKHRLNLLRSYLLDPDEVAGKAALQALQEIHIHDFTNFFRTVRGTPVAVALLVGPLSRFLPHVDGESSEMACEFNRTVSEVKSILRKYDVDAPTGPLGCKVLICHKRLLEMQLNALMTASIEVSLESFVDSGGGSIKPVVMSPNLILPAVESDVEIAYIEEIIQNVAKKVVLQHQHRLRGTPLATACDYSVGAMLCTPAGCLRAGSLTPGASLLAFDLNGLTGHTTGCTKETRRQFVPCYIREGIYQVDPFKSLDERTVGYLLQAAIKEWRDHNGSNAICATGEQVQNTSAIAYLQGIGCSAVAVPPALVPLAKISAAQAAIHRSLPQER